MPKERVCANDSILPAANVSTETLRERLRALVEKMSEEQASCAHLMMRMAVIGLDNIAKALKPAYHSWDEEFDPVELGGLFDLADCANEQILDEAERGAWVAAICLSAVKGNAKAFRTIEEALRLRIAHLQ